MTPFERYGEKTSEANMHNHTGLTAACSAYLGGTRREGQEVTKEGVYRLPYAIYLCSEPVSDSPRVAQPSISGVTHAQFAEGLHFSAQ